MLPSSFLLIFEARKDLQPSCLMASPVRRIHQDLRPPLRPIGEVNRPGTTTTSKTLLKLLNPRPHRDGRTFRDYNPRKTLLVLLNPRPHRGGRTFRDYNQGKNPTSTFESTVPQERQVVQESQQWAEDLTRNTTPEGHPEVLRPRSHGWHI